MESILRSDIQCHIATEVHDRNWSNTGKNQHTHNTHYTGNLRFWNPFIWKRNATFFRSLHSLWFFWFQKIRSRKKWKCFIIAKNSTISRENVELIYSMTPQIQHPMVLKVPFIYPLMLLNIIACLLCPRPSLMCWQCRDSQHHGRDPEKELFVFMK